MKQLRRIILAAALLASAIPASAQVPPAVPPLPDTERRTTYTISGSTCACGVGFALYGDSTDYQNWVEVWLNGVRIDYNNSISGWTITSPTGPIGSIPRPITNAVLTFNAAQTGTVQIVGARRPRRVAQFPENRGVAARDMNQIITDMVATMRETWDKNNDLTGRVIMGLPGETLGTLPAAASRANGILGFDATGKPAIYANSGVSVVPAANVTFLQGDSGAVSETVQGRLSQVVTPEDFGAKHDGSDDAPAINAAITALNARGKGTLRCTDGVTYTLGTYSSNGLSMINMKPAVSYQGCKFKLADNVNKAASTFTGTCSGTTLTASAVTGTIALNQTLAGNGINTVTTIASQIGGTPGGAGTYQTSAACTSSGASIVGVTQFAHIMGAYYPTDLSHTFFKDVEIDYNGTKNMCAVGGIGTCWAINGLIVIDVGDDIEFDNPRLNNNSGSNNLLVGRNVYPPVAKNIRVKGGSAQHNGDNINAAALDHSTWWVDADGCSITGTASDYGPKTNGAAFEIHGRNCNVNGNTVQNYFNGANLANQSPAIGGGTNDSFVTSFTNNTLESVNRCVTVWSVGAATNVNVLVSGNNCTLDPANPAVYVDADSLVSTSGNNLGLSITNNLFQAPVTGSAATWAGITVGAWQSALVYGNHITNTLGPAIQTTSNFPGGGVLSIMANVIKNPGLSSNSSFKVGISTPAGSGTLSNALIVGNSIAGTSLTYGINSGLVSTKGLIAHNTISGATTDVNNTGTAALIGPNSYGAGVATWLGTPSSANLRAALTDETGTGAAVFGTSPNITTPTGIVKGDVGLGNVDNTSDATKNAAAVALTNKTGVQSTGFQLTNLFASSTAPTINTGFCTSPSISANNGTAAFTLTIGSGCSGGTGTITMPAATTGWACDFVDVTTPGTNIPYQTGGTATTVTVQNYARSGSAANFNSGDVLRVKCSAY